MNAVRTLLSACYGRFFNVCEDVKIRPYGYVFFLRRTDVLFTRYGRLYLRPTDVRILSLRTFFMLRTDVIGTSVENKVRRAFWVM